MSRWTDEELRELTTLWPTHSVLQIAKQLHRPRAAIRSKAKRLRLDGPPPHNPSDDAGNLPKRRPLKAGPFGRGRRSQREDRAKLDGAATGALTKLIHHSAKRVMLAVLDPDPVRRSAMR